MLPRLGVLGRVDAFHTVLISGPAIWCSSCGAYCVRRLAGLAKPCLKVASRARRNARNALASGWLPGDPTSYVGDPTRAGQVDDLFIDRAAVMVPEWVIDVIGVPSASGRFPSLRSAEPL